MKSPIKPTTRDLRKINRQSLLELVYFNAPLSRLELSQLSGLSPATVGNVIAELLNDGILLEVGSQESQGGRPRTSLSLNPDYGYFIGIEVGETQIQIEIVDLTLQKVSHTRQSLSAGDFLPQQIVEYIVAGVNILLAQSEIAAERVLGIGIGMPGIVDHEMGVSVFAPNWGWQNVPLLELLQARLHIPIYLDNGAHAMALAERWFGAARQAENLMVLLIATGVGSSIIMSGELYRGASNSAGEWGHTCVQPNGALCRCGSHGCLESYIGAPGIIRRYRELAPDSAILMRRTQLEIVAGIRGAAEADDAAAVQVLSEAAQYLGIGIANIINLLNPQQIVIGGWSGLLLGSYLLPKTRSTIDAYALKQPARVAQIHVSALGDHAVSIGAASLALERFLRPEGFSIARVS
ncbi:MAG: ROK family protein [Anaerolineae bacterium]